jgi:hypothetical protein
VHATNTRKFLIMANVVSAWRQKKIDRAPSLESSTSSHPLWNIFSEEVEATGDGTTHKVVVCRNPDAPEEEETKPKKKWLRRKKSREEVPLPDSRNDTALDETEFADAGENATSGNALARLLLDRRQRKAIYRHFAVDPNDVLEVEQEKSMPVPDADDHVVIKIQVRCEIVPCFHA